MEPAAKPTPDQFSMELDDPELLECFLNYPILEENEPFPLDYRHIQTQQQQDPILQQLKGNEPHKYPVQTLDGIDLICYLPTPNSPWKIYLPSTILDRTILWFHQAMNHNGMNRLYDAMNTHFYNFELRQQIEHLVRACNTYQRYKTAGPGYGHLPPREAPLMPWSEIVVNLIGPWTININSDDIQFCAITFIDTVTNLPEFARINNKSSEHIGQKLKDMYGVHNILVH